MTIEEIRKGAPKTASHYKILDGDKFQWSEKGTSKPIYIIYAKSEKKAYKKLVSYLGKIGKLSSLENLERFYEVDEIKPLSEV